MDCALGKVTPGDLVYHLYTNNVTPNKVSDTATFTEVADSLYSPITTALADWSRSTTSNITTASHSTIEFFLNTTQVAVGYYVTCTALASTVVVFAERPDPGPFTGLAGGSIKLLPEFQVN